MEAAASPTLAPPPAYAGGRGAGGGVAAGCCAGTVVVQAEEAPTTFALRGGEHEVRLVTSDHSDGNTITVTATNLLSGDEFEATLNAGGVAALVPAGFAESAASVAGFYGFLQDAYGQETGTVAVLDEAEAGAAELKCTSCEVVSGDPAAAARRTVALSPMLHPLGLLMDTLIMHTLFVLVTFSLI
jgi:hypothetical protein